MYPEETTVPMYDAFERPNAMVTAIENGYLVSCYRQGRNEQWYCIDHQEIAEKLIRLL